MGLDVDPKLAQSAGTGDREAFRRLAEILAPQVYDMAWRMTYVREDAEDLSQEVFVTLWRNLRRYDPSRPFAPWFRRVFTNVALNYRRKLKPSRSLDQDPPSTPTPEGEGQVVAESLKNLPPEYRLVVTLRYFQEMPVSEIARTLSVPQGTVKTWLFRAREALRQKLKVQGVAP